MCYFIYRHNYLKVALMCKGKELPQNIKILNLSVEGLKPKFEDPNFLEFIKDYDISIFSKTWKADTSKLNIEGFWDYSQVRPKHKNAIRQSEGITSPAKHNIRPGVRSHMNKLRLVDSSVYTPIYKSGGNDNPDNYRGIAINSCLSKVFNLLLAN